MAIFSIASLHKERNQLVERRDKLSQFIWFNPAFGTLTVQHQTLLGQQLTIMAQYLTVLHARLMLLAELA